mmetsp:Transcript_13001/g.25231  ORF Transcript_13001/g.25231 Transcript_13001/m.25231 type:complete len:397 (-) Transcript_13001:139-1329(-)
MKRVAKEGASPLYVPHITDKRLRISKSSHIRLSQEFGCSSICHRYSVIYPLTGASKRCCRFQLNSIASFSAHNPFSAPEASSFRDSCEQTCLKILSRARDYYLSKRTSCDELRTSEEPAISRFNSTILVLASWTNHYIGYNLDQSAGNGSHQNLATLKEFTVFLGYLVFALQFGSLARGANILDHVSSSCATGLTHERFLLLLSSIDAYASRNKDPNDSFALINESEEGKSALRIEKSVSRAGALCRSITVHLQDLEESFSFALHKFSNGAAMTRASHKENYPNGLCCTKASISCFARTLSSILNAVYSHDYDGHSFQPKLRSTGLMYHNEQHYESISTQNKKGMFEFEYLRKCEKTFSPRLLSSQDEKIEGLLQRRVKRKARAYAMTPSEDREAL